MCYFQCERLCRVLSALAIWWLQVLPLHRSLEIKSTLLWAPIKQFEDTAFTKKQNKNITLQGIYVWSEKTFEENNPILFHLQPPYSQVSDFLYYQRLLLSIIIVNHLLSGSDTI